MSFGVNVHQPARRSATRSRPSRRSTVCNGQYAIGILGNTLCIASYVECAQSAECAETLLVADAVGLAARTRRPDVPCHGARAGRVGRAHTALAHARGVWAVHTLHWRLRSTCVGGRRVAWLESVETKSKRLDRARGRHTCHPSPRLLLRVRQGDPRLARALPYSFIYGCSLYVRGVVPRRRPRRARAATWHVQQQQHHGVTRVSPHSRRELFPLSPRF